MALWSLQPNTTCEGWNWPAHPGAGPPDFGNVPLQQLRAYIVTPSEPGSSPGKGPRFFLRGVVGGNNPIYGFLEHPTAYTLLSIGIGGFQRFFTVWSTTEQYNQQGGVNVQFFTALYNPTPTIGAPPAY